MKMGYFQENEFKKIPIPFLQKWPKPKKMRIGRKRIFFSLKYEKISRPKFFHSAKKKCPQHILLRFSLKSEQKKMSSKNFQFILC